MPYRNNLRSYSGRSIDKVGGSPDGRRSDITGYTTSATKYGRKQREDVAN